MPRAQALPRSTATFVPHGRSTPHPRSSERPEALAATPRAKPPKPPSAPSRAPEQARSRGRARGQRDFLYYFCSSPLSLSALTGVSQRAFLYYFARRPLARSAALLSSRAPSPWVAAAPSLDRSSGTAASASPLSLWVCSSRAQARLGALSLRAPSSELIQFGAACLNPRSLRAKRLAAASSGEFGAYHYFVYLCRANRAGVVVQLVRIPACHAGGRGFESRPYR